MLMPASSEFVALCQTQVDLLKQGLGAVLSIVYLTEELTEAANAKIVPIAAYPEAVATWREEQILSLLSNGNRASHRQTASEVRSLQFSQKPNPIAQLPLLPGYSDNHSATPLYSTHLELHPLEAAEQALSRQQQIVVPLIHDEMVMGLLVTARADRPWTDSEQSQIEQIAETIALACVLDQRLQWLAQDVRQQRLLREQRHDLLDNLLHQFRNPLTAMRTFGKLLARRIRPEDANRSAAEGIVRESDRLQDLLKQFDAAIALDETELSRLLEAESVLQLPASPPLLSASPHNNLLVGASIQLEAHPIAEVLTPMLESARAIAQDRQLEFWVVLPTDLPPVQMDVRALREVLSNLLDNALKYTPAGGQVAVMVQPVAPDSSDIRQRQAIAIIDTGPGIPQQDLEHLFERHYRGVQAATNIPGTGLGLAIARDLVQQMQGEIKVFSPACTSPFHLSAFAAQRFANIPHPASFSPGTAVIVSLPESLG